jgi:type II secretory pathway pseudopilin PulG
MLGTTRARLMAASEEGFGLIEVLVSAVVLVIVVLGVMAGLDSVARTAGANQSKTVAGTLAEKDLERLRSLKTADLSVLADLEPESRNVKVGNITYKILSKATLVDDTSGQDVSCEMPSGRGGYLRISSTVSAPDAKVKPVTMSSIVAPQPGKGTLTALVRSAEGLPVKNLPVQAIGPTASTESTNDVGCAIFVEREAGSYVLRLNQAGWVDPDGNVLVEKNATVSAGNITTIEFVYDRAGSFQTNVVNSGNVADTSQGVMAAHTGVSTGFRSLTGSSSNYTFSLMFPFTTPYEVYAGTCTGNNPVNWIADYFATHPLAVAQVLPGQNPGATRTVIEPTINVQATFKNGTSTTNASGANVYAYPRTEDCPTARISLGQTQTNGQLSTSTRGLPFGEYDLCVDYQRTISSTTKRWRIRFGTGSPAAPGVLNTNPAGTSTQAAAFDWANSSTNPTTCP